MVELLGTEIDLNVKYGAAIAGKVTWVNRGLQRNADVVVGFILGKNGQLYSFTYDGVDYLVGSMVSALAPSVDATATTQIPSYGVWLSDGNTYDAYAFVGGLLGQVGTLLMGDRVIGLRAADIEAGHVVYSAAKWFNNVLSIEDGAYATHDALMSYILIYHDVADWEHHLSPICAYRGKRYNDNAPQSYYLLWQQTDVQAAICITTEPERWVVEVAKVAVKAIHVFWWTGTEAQHVFTLPECNTSVGYVNSTDHWGPQIDPGEMLQQLTVRCGISQELSCHLVGTFRGTEQGSGIQQATGLFAYGEDVEAVICVTPKGGNNWTIEVAKQTSDQVVMWRTGVSGYILVREGFGDGYRIFYITPA